MLSAIQSLLRIFTITQVTFINIPAFKNTINSVDSRPISKNARGRIPINESMADQPSDLDNITAIPTNYTSNTTGRNCTTNKLSATKSLANNSEAQRFTSSASRRIAEAPECASRKIKCQINADDKFAGRTNDATTYSKVSKFTAHYLEFNSTIHINAWKTTD